MICTYHLGQFSGDAVIDIMRTHPMVIIGGILQRNPFFVPPEQFVPEFRERRAKQSTRRARSESPAHRDSVRLQNAVETSVSELSGCTLEALRNDSEFIPVRWTGSDLYCRLNRFPIEVPPLRDRRADISLLVEYITHRYANRAGKRIRRIARETMKLLESLDWAGQHSRAAELCRTGCDRLRR